MNADKRLAIIKELRGKGSTLREIGLRFHLSHQRVQQILSPNASIKFLVSQNIRKTCYICRRKLRTLRKFCVDCINVNKLSSGGRELTRGIVRGRDANTCQVCGYLWKGTEKKRLDVHHLEGKCGKLTKSYDGPEMIHKLITVCHKCHFNLHDHAQNGTNAKVKS